MRKSLILAGGGLSVTETKDRDSLCFSVHGQDAYVTADEVEKLVDALGGNFRNHKELTYYTTEDLKARERAKRSLVDEDNESEETTPGDYTGA